MAEPLKFLVVDDALLFRQLVIKCLRQAWPTAKIEEAMNGYQAGTKMTQMQPDVMILDIGLPGVDGVDVFTSLKMSPLLSKTRVVVCTGSDNPEIRAQMMAKGARAFLKKPFDPNVLISVISRIL